MIRPLAVRALIMDYCSSIGKLLDQNQVIRAEQIGHQLSLLLNDLKRNPSLSQKLINHVLAGHLANAANKIFKHLPYLATKLYRAAIRFEDESSYLVFHYTNLIRSLLLQNKISKAKKESQLLLVVLDVAKLRPSNPRLAHSLNSIATQLLKHKSYAASEMLYRAAIQFANPNDGANLIILHASLIHSLLLQGKIADATKESQVLWSRHKKARLMFPNLPHAGYLNRLARQLYAHKAYD